MPPEDIGTGTYRLLFRVLASHPEEVRSFYDDTVAAIVKYDDALDWGGNEVRFVIAIAGLNNEHLGILSKIAIVFSEDEEVEKLLAASTPEEIESLLGDVNED